MTYVLKSEVEHKTYVGITTDINRRLNQHNNGYYKYTKRYIPWYVIYIEGFKTGKESRLRERYLKSASGRRWLKKYIFKN